MISIPFVALLLQGIPEEIAVTTLAFVIARAHLKWNLIIVIGFVLAFTTYLVRLLPIPFGIHTIVLLVLLFLFLLTIGQANLSSSILACFLSYLTLAVTEFVSLAVLMPVFGITPKTLLSDPAKRIMLGEPGVFLIFLIAFLTHLLMNMRKRSMENDFHRKY